MALRNCRPTHAALIWIIATTTSALAQSSPNESTPRGSTLPDCVYLATRPTHTEPGLDGGILLRELFRQALLIAARDELGLATRDMTLRESLASVADRTTSASTRVLTLDLDVFVHADGRIKLELRQGTDAAGPQAWSGEFRLPTRGSLSYPEVVQLAERLSRDDFADALRAFGLHGAGPLSAGNAALPPDLARRLTDLSPFAQFAAIRRTHQHLREAGDSAALRGALVRGYANLTLLTAMLWNAGYKAYGARALLYAERMVVADPASPWALWHRAYARALVGLHQAALQDLAQAKELACATAAPPPAPPWVTLLGLYCRYDAETLAGEGVLDKPESQLADLLAGVTGLRSLGRRGYVTLARDVLARNPECYRVLDDYVSQAGVSDGHWLTRKAPWTLTCSLPRRLRSLSGLPRPALSWLPHSPGLFAKWLHATPDDPPTLAGVYFANLPPICAALRDGGNPGCDGGEPSWAALAGLIEDLTFLHVHRRAEFMTGDWGVPADDFIAAAEPLVARHPYARWLLSYRTRDREGGAALARAWEDLHVSDADFPQRAMLRVMRRLPAGPVKQRGLDAWNRMFLHVDAIAGDYEAAFNASKQRAPGFARQLLQVSPHAPRAIVALIKYDWEHVADQAAQWERDYSHCAQVLENLAYKYNRLGRSADARRVLRACCQRSVDYWAWTTLAYLERESGDVARWKSMLELYLLQYAEESLEHAHIRDELARYYMSIGDYAAALPYAEQAAESGAGWAWEGAALANEGSQRWSAAESWSRQITERYADYGADWLFFCARTGHGQRDAASAPAVAWARRQPDDAEHTLLGRAAVVYMLTSHPSDAPLLLEHAFARSKDPVYGHFLAALADAAGDNAACAKWLSQIETRAAQRPSSTVNSRLEFVELAQIFHRAVTAASVPPADLKRIERLVDSAEAKDRSGLLYFTARFLERRGPAAAAQGWLKRAALDPTYSNWTVILARDLCRTREIALPAVPPRVEPVKH